MIPCFNVGSLCLPVIRSCAEHVGRIVAVDDGSTDDTADYLRQAERATAPITQVLTLPTNRGKGVALLRGFRQALRHADCDVIVTLDGDGQHRAGDIPRVALPCLDRSAELVIAQRQFPPGVPQRSRIGNNLSRAILTSAFRHAPRDTQCGLRALRRELADYMVRTLIGNRYDTEARILMLSLRERRRIVQTPIPAIYLGKNESSHYRPLADSLRILGAFFTIVALPNLGIPVNPNGLRKGLVWR